MIDVVLIIILLFIFSISTKERFNSSRHTICRRPNTTVDLNSVMLYMDVFTSSVEEVEYSLVFEPVENFTLRYIIAHLVVGTMLVIELGTSDDV